MSFYLYILGLSLSDLMAITVIKFWHLKGNLAYLVAGMALFALAAWFLGMSLKYEGIAIVNVIWVALSAILVTIIGYYFFKEPIALRQFVGITIIIIGLIIVEWK